MQPVFPALPGREIDKTEGKRVGGNPGKQNCLHHSQLHTLHGSVTLCGPRPSVSLGKQIHRQAPPAPTLFPATAHDVKGLGVCEQARLLRSTCECVCAHLCVSVCLCVCALMCACVCSCVCVCLCLGTSISRKPGFHCMTSRSSFFFLLWKPRTDQQFSFPLLFLFFCCLPSQNSCEKRSGKGQGRW